MEPVSNKDKTISKMSIDHSRFDTKTLIARYEKIFINRVLNTYPLLKEFDEVGSDPKSDGKFYTLLCSIESQYLDIENAKNKFYDLLARDGGIKNEFEDGIEEKYRAIKHKIDTIFK